MYEICVSNMSIPADSTAQAKDALLAHSVALQARNDEIAALKEEVCSNFVQAPSTHTQ